MTSRLGESQVPASMFDPLPTSRTSAAIVTQIRARIRGGQLPIGSRLPAERELCEQFGVSRLSVREALRVLESSGLIEIRLGARGGAFVTAPTAGSAGQGITDLLSTSGLSAANVTEARILFELGVVMPLVSERATSADLAELRALCDEEERTRNAGTYEVAVSFGFHLRLAAAAHNPAVGMIMESFREAILMSIREARHEGNQGAAEHRAVVDAIERGDAAGARQLMAAHLQRTADAVTGRLAVRLGVPAVTVDYFRHGGVGSNPLSSLTGAAGGIPLSRCRLVRVVRGSAGSSRRI